VNPTAAGCPGVTELETRVDRLLGAGGRARARMLDANIAIVVEFTPLSRGHRAQVRLHGARTGQRTLSDESADCHELAQAVALTLAILIDPSFVPPSETQAISPDGQVSGRRPSAGLPDAPSAPSPNAAPVPPASTARSVPEDREPERSTPARSTLAPPTTQRESLLSASVFAGAGATSRLARPLTPAFTGGAALDVLERVGIRAGVLWIPATNVDELTPGTVALELLAGTFDLCAHFARPGAVLRLSLCAGLTAGSLEARTRGYRFDGEGSLTFYALQGGLLADLPVGRPLGVWFNVRGYWPLEDYGFVVEGVGTVHPTRIPGFSAILGPRLRLF
jgi:hypothetical protein